MCSHVSTSGSRGSKRLYRSSVDSQSSTSCHAFAFLIMVMAQHQDVYGHGLTCHSTSSLPDTPLSSTYRDSCAIERKFSSPLAECYAADKDLRMLSNHQFGCGIDDLARAVKLPTPIYHYSHTQDYRCPKSFVGFSPSKESPARETSNPLPTRIGETATSSLRNRSTICEAPTQVSRDRRRVPTVPKMPSATTAYVGQKPLLSPISFDSTTEISDRSDSTEDGSFDEGTSHKLTLQLSSQRASEHRCASPHCEGSSVAGNKQDAAQLSWWSSPHRPISIRGRSISVGEKRALTSPETKAEASGRQRTFPARQRATAGPKELRRSAGSPSLKKDRTPWVDQIVKATKRAGSYQSNGCVDGYSSNPRARPRLWLDATNTEKGTAEAVHRDPDFRSGIR